MMAQVQFDQNITACVTMGRRPVLLEQTLISLGPLLARIPVLAINDFGDEETNEVFRRLCPHGKLVNGAAKLGHHRAIDLLYGAVQTDYVFHFEDDWQFDRTNFLEECEEVLNSASGATSVCVRNLEDFVLPDLHSKIRSKVTPNGVEYSTLLDIHPQWYGYTFNPHVAPLAAWRNLGGFSSFKKERHISRTNRARGRFACFLNRGACSHIGAMDSVASPQPPLGKRIKMFLKSKF